MGNLESPYLSITYVHKLTGGMNKRSDPLQVINHSARAHWPKALERVAMFDDPQCTQSSLEMSGVGRAKPTLPQDTQEAPLIWSCGEYRDAV